MPVPRHYADDARGRFIAANDWRKEPFRIAATNVVMTAKAGTIRGLHYQRDPFWQTKLIQVISGSIYGAAAFPDGTAVVSYALSASDTHGMMVPGYLAHGYQAIEDDTIVLYHTSAPYHPAAEGGLRWDDPKLGIPWPLVPTIISEKDQAWPLL